MSLVAAFFSLVPSVGLTTSFSGETVTTLRGGQMLLGLGLRGDTLLLLDLFPGLDLVS